MTALTIFHYHPATGEFLGTGQADPDPKDQRNWLIPAYATTEVPPEGQAGFARVFLGGEWGQVEDHRGKVVWTDHETSFTIEDLGPLPEGASEEQPEAPPPTAQELRGQLNDKLRAVPSHGFGGPTMEDIFNV